MWMAVAITAVIFAVGNILFGHFEERTPKWKRVTKVVLVLTSVGIISESSWTGMGTCTGCADAP